jgi:hypothetical protein
MTRLGVRNFAVSLPTRHNVWELVELGQFCYSGTDHT